MQVIKTADKERILSQSFHDVAREKQLKYLLEATEGRGAFPHKPVDSSEAQSIAFHELEKCNRQSQHVLPEEKVSVTGVAGTLFSRPVSDEAEKKKEQEKVQDSGPNVRRPGQD